MSKTVALGIALFGIAGIGGCAALMGSDPVSQNEEYEEEDDLYVYDDDDHTYYPYSSYTKSITGKKLYKYQNGGYQSYASTPRYNPGYKSSGQKTYYGTSTPASSSSYGKSGTSSSTSSFGSSGSSSSGAS